MTETQPKATPAPGPMLTLEIGGTTYQLYRLPALPDRDGEIADGYRLEKPNGECYDCSRAADGTLSCDCPHFEFRCRGIVGMSCKHLAALRRTLLF